MSVSPHPDASPDDDPYTVSVERLGSAYRVIVEPFGALFEFRDVTLGREASADVSVHRAGHRIFRSGTTLSLSGRRTIARTAADLTRTNGDQWNAVTFVAVEAAIEAVEQLSAGVDLRTAALTSDRARWAIWPVQPTATGYVIGPGESGKSTKARACGVSVASGREIIPGLSPRLSGPVLYVVSEDPSQEWHVRSIEAICRGAEIDRARLAHPIWFHAARGRPLHRLVRSLAERAADAALVILDAQQGFMGVDENGNVRDQAARFWNAVDELERPTMVIAHPNLAGARDWNKADGRAAGAEVNRDRPRISWAVRFRDEPSAVGTSFRRYELECTKHNNGPRPGPVTFAAAWQYPVGDTDPGVLRFLPSEPLGDALPDEPTPKEADTLRAWKEGHRTPSAIATALGIDANTAKARVRRLKAKGFIRDEQAVEFAA